MLNKLKASDKLNLLVFVMSIFIIGIGLYGISEMKKMNMKTKTLHDDRLIPIEQLATVRYNYLFGILSSAQQVQTGQLTYVECLGQIAASQKIIAAKWSAYLQTYLTSEEAVLVKEATYLMNSSLPIIEKLKQVLNQQDIPALNNFIHTEFYPAINPVINSINELFHLQVKIGGEIYENSSAAYTTALKQFILLIVVSLAFAIPFSYFLVRKVKHLIRDLHYSNKIIAKSEEKCRALIDHAGDAIFMLDKDLMITDANEYACRLLGYTKKELIGMKASAFLSPQDVPKQEHFFESLKKNITPLSERRLTRKDGSVVETEVNARMLEDGGFISIVRDITERRRAEEKMRESERKYRNIFENVQDVFFQTDPEGKILEVSPSIKDHLGFTREELINTPAKNIYYSLEDRNTVVELLQKNNEIRDYEVMFQSKTGEEVCVSLNGKIVPATDGIPSHIDGMFRNITERKKMEAELVEHKEQLALFIEHSPASLAMFDNEMRYIATSRRWLNDYNIGLIPVIGKYHYEIFPEIPQRWKDIHQRCLQGTTAKNEEDFFMRADGTKEYIRWEIHPWHKASGHIGGIIMFTEVITERIKAEERIKESEANYRQMFELSPAPMWLFDEESTRFIQVNQACVDHYGYSEKEFLTMKIDDIMPATNLWVSKNLQGKNSYAIANFMGGGKHIKKSGEIMDVITSSIPVILNGKKQILLVAIDVTERSQYEQKLAKASIKAQEDERYEIGGELHDNVCQLLAASLMNLSMMKKPLPQESKEYFDRTNQYINLATSEIRNLSHRLAPAFSAKATLEDAFEDLLNSFNIEKKHQVYLDFHQSAKSYPLNRDLQLNLYRILQEQLRNIYKYANATHIVVEVGISNNNLRMRVADNGVGFDVEGIKEGIGLANMNRRVLLLSGNFEIDASVGNGCEIIVEVPLTNNN